MPGTFQEGWPSVPSATPLKTNRMQSAAASGVNQVCGLSGFGYLICETYARADLLQLAREVLEHSRLARRDFAEAISRRVVHLHNRRSNSGHGGGKCRGGFN